MDETLIVNYMYKRVKELQEDEKLSFEEAVKIIQLAILDDIREHIRYGVDYLGQIH